MNKGGGSKGSGSEEPLVPDIIDDEFFTNLTSKVPEITKALRQKDTHDNADNVQRLLICCNRYKSDFHMEQMHVEELKEDIAKLNERLENAAEISRLDRDTIKELRGIIENAWKQKDAAQVREQVAQDEVIKLREKAEILEDTLQRLTDKNMGLQSKRDEKKERDHLNAEIRDLHKRLQIQRLYTAEVETMTQTLEEKNKSLLKLLEETSSEAYNSKKRVEALQKELHETKAAEAKNIEFIAQIKSQNEHLTKVKVRQNLQILSLKTNLEHLNTQYVGNCNKLAKLTVDLEYAVQERDRNKRDLTQRLNVLKVREDEIIKLKQDNSNLAKSQESAIRKYGAIKESKHAVDEENIRVKTQMSTQDKELESMRRLVQHFEKNIEILTKERDTLKRTAVIEHKSFEEMDGLLKKARHEIKSLQDTINALDVRYKKLVEDAKKLRKEKAKKIDEIQTWIDKVDTLENDMQLKENCETELKRTIADLEVKSVKLQTQCGALTNEKNTLMRNLQAAEDEKLKLNQQIENLQTDIENQRHRVSYRDAEISKLQLQIDKMEKERRMLKNDLRNAQLGHQHTRSELVEKKKENVRLSKSIQEDEQKLSHLKKDFDHIMNEKNNVCAALTKRNEEFLELKGDLENLQNVYNQTEKKFSQSKGDMRIMRIEIKNLRTERNVLRKDRENAADLRQELLQMHRLLNQERIKARALADEMLTPMNIHRWRNLKGKDPEKMDLIERIQALRKQMLNQNVTSLEQERALEETQRLYAALKEFMLKLPSHKIREELNSAKATIFGKERKLKAVIAELNIQLTEEQQNNVKFENLKTDLTSAKTELMIEKKKKQKLLEERQIFIQMQAQCFPEQTTHSVVQRTLGAGFKVVGNI